MCIHRLRGCFCVQAVVLFWSHFVWTLLSLALFARDINVCSLPASEWEWVADVQYAYNEIEARWVWDISGISSFIVYWTGLQLHYSLWLEPSVTLGAGSRTSRNVSQDFFLLRSCLLETNVTILWKLRLDMYMLRFHCSEETSWAYQMSRGCSTLAYVHSYYLQVNVYVLGSN
jgi:hypothetical protein